MNLGQFVCIIQNSVSNLEGWNSDENLKGVQKHFNPIVLVVLERVWVSSACVEIRWKSKSSI